MVSITLSVSPEIKEKMGSFPEMNWSGFIRSKIEEKVKKLTWKEEMLKKLEEEKDFEDWAVEMGREARKSRLAELKKKGLI